MRETLFVRKPNQMEKHKLCLLSILLLHPHPSSQPEGTTTLPSLQPILIDDNGTPATWTLVLSQQAIDRQDRTQTEGRFSLLETQWNTTTLEIQPGIQEYSTGQGLIVRR